MKRLLMVSLAAAMFALPTAGTGAYAQDYGRHDNDRHDNGRHDNDRHDNDRHDSDGDWNPGQHNGYMWHGRWHYGRPPAYAIGHPGYSAGWHRWRRGERVPVELRTRYVVVNDWRGHHLRPPPRGYHWVRDDRGEYILIGIATGLILSAIINNS